MGCIPVTKLFELKGRAQKYVQFLFLYHFDSRFDLGRLRLLKVEARRNDGESEGSGRDYM